MSWWCMLFFFKQKTAYEMRMSDWSSDVCSSDLVEELKEVPEGVPVIFSAHGVPKEVPDEAERRRLFYLDATCPLVSKVHREAEHHERSGRQILLIGHAGHPEVIGTMGQVPEGAILLVRSEEHPSELQSLMRI